jgi:hypothetical protein
MSIDNVHEKAKAKKDMNWTVFIEQANTEIKRLQRRLYALRKSLAYFKKQADSGVEYPVKKT